MPSIRPLLILIAVAVAAVAADGDVLRTIPSGGKSRTYWLHLPAGASATQPLPLVLAFHGFTDSGQNFSAGTGLSGIADQRGFIVAFPNALPQADMLGVNSWAGLNDGLRDGNDRFIIDVIADVAAHHPVDPRRIFVTGMSQGGFMCYVAASLYPDVVAAIAPVVAGFPAGTPASAFLPARPLPVLMINGTLDTLCPYAGGSGIFGIQVGPIPELAQTIATHDGCWFGPLTYDLPNWNWFDGCTAQARHWLFGADGSEVILLTVIGGGHSWPGNRQWIPLLTTGTCYDFDAGAVIWDFFARHPMPAGTAN